MSTVSSSPTTSSRSTQKHTGRQSYQPPPGGFREVLVVTGRQSGKSRIASLITAYESLFAEPEPDRTPVFSVVIAQNLRGVMRTLFSYLTSFVEPELPIFHRCVEARTADSIRLDSGITVACYPCTPRSIRGLRCKTVVLDEAAYFLSTENYPTDTEMVKAARPTLLNTDGRLIVISSPGGQTGHVWKAFSRHYGVDSSDVLVWKATSPEMNPTLTPAILERMKQEDALAYENEILAEFASGSLALFDYEALDAVTNPDRPIELAPQRGVKYLAFCDMSGGRRDAAALAIAHKDQSRKLVIADLVRRWPAPHNPENVVGEIVGTLQRYGVRSVAGDKYSASWCSDSYRAKGITYEASKLDRSGLYLELLHTVNAQTLELPNDEVLLRELRGLQRRRLAGRDRIDHPPGQHDDSANALAGAVVEAETKSRKRGEVRQISW